jgi:DNA repair protein SbcD/Mre11
MRIVHTSDWHAGRIWKGKDRLNELQSVLDEIAEFIDHERVDLLLVSGDIFDSGAPAATAERAVFRFFRRVGATGAKTVAIAGNHDSAARLEAWGTLTELVDVYAVARPRPADKGGVIRLDTRSGEAAVVAAIPWAPVRDIVSALELAVDETLARQKYAEWMKLIVDNLRAGFRSDAVNLLMAHTHLDGARFGTSERKVHLGEDWAATAQILPSDAHYVALGHIHKPQRIEAAPSPTYYAGSPLQLDFGETGEEKSFVVIDAHRGRPAEINRIPYRSGVPLRQIRATLAELERDATALCDAGWLSVTVPITVPDPDLGGKVRRLLPNTLIVDADLPQAEERPPEIDRSSLSPPDLFRAYFRREHSGAEPPDKLVELFAELRQQAEEGEE